MRAADLDATAALAGQLIAGNRRHAGAFAPGQLGANPARALAVLTCMDARIDPLGALGLEVGDAHVLRNAGGRVTGDVLRSLMVSTVVLGVRDIAVVQHDGCGMAGLDDEQLRERVAEATGQRPDGVDFATFSDVELSVKGDVARILAHDGILAERVAGFVYDVADGRLRRVA